MSGVRCDTLLPFGMVSERALRAISVVLAAAIGAAALAALAAKYEGTVRDLPPDSGIWFLAAIFSLAVVWIFAEAISVLLSRLIASALVCRLTALAIAVVIHFSVGAIAFAVFDNTPPGQRREYDAVIWVPAWIVGLLFHVGHFRLCL